MTPQDATKILELPAEVSAEQVEARFRELRAKLEEKIVQAPTPGLKDKYRKSLEEVTQAFDTLMLACDAGTLPLAQRISENQATRQTSTAPSPVPVGPTAPRRDARTSGGKRTEFILIAVIAVVLLAGGGWWVAKTRAEAANAAKLAAEAARIAEETRLAKDRAEAAELDRRTKLGNQLQSRLVELNVRFDALARSESLADRELAELRSAEREAVREAKGSITPVTRLAGAKVRAQERLVATLRDTLATHPARIARMKAEQLLQARAQDEAVPVVETYAASLEQLQKELVQAREASAVTSRLRVESNLREATWKVVDSFGAEYSGTGPGEIPDMALGSATVVFSAPRWPEIKHTAEVTRTGEATVSATFIPAKLTISVAPAGARVRLLGTGAREAGDNTWILDPGEYFIAVEHDSHAPKIVRVNAIPAAELKKSILLDDDYVRSAAAVALWRLREVESDSDFLDLAQSLMIRLAQMRDREQMKQVIDLILDRKIARAEIPILLIYELAAELGLKEEVRALCQRVNTWILEKRLTSNFFMNALIQGQATALIMLGQRAEAEEALLRAAKANHAQSSNDSDLSLHIMSERAGQVSSLASRGYYADARWMGALALQGTDRWQTLIARGYLARADAMEALEQGDIVKSLDAWKRYFEISKDQEAFYGGPRLLPAHVIESVMVNLSSKRSPTVEPLLKELLRMAQSMAATGQLKGYDDRKKAILEQWSSLPPPKEKISPDKARQLLTEAHSEPASAAIRKLLPLME